MTEMMIMNPNGNYAHYLKKYLKSDIDTLVYCLGNTKAQGVCYSSIMNYARMNNIYLAIIKGTANKIIVKR